MNKGCRKTQDALATGETLAPLEEMHLSCCDDCAAVAASLLSLDGDLTALREEVPEGLGEDVSRRALAESQLGSSGRNSWGSMWTHRSGLIASLAVVFVIGFVAVPSFLSYIQTGNQKRMMGEIKSLATATESHAIDTDGYPSLDSYPGHAEPDSTVLSQLDSLELVRERALGEVEKVPEGNRSAAAFIPGRSPQIVSKAPERQAGHAEGQADDRAQEIEIEAGSFTSWPKQTEIGEASDLTRGRLNMAKRRDAEQGEKRRSAKRFSPQPATEAEPPAYSSEREEPAAETMAARFGDPAVEFRHHPRVHGGLKDDEDFGRSGLSDVSDGVVALGNADPPSPSVAGAGPAQIGARLEALESSAAVKNESLPRTKGKKIALGDPTPSDKPAASPVKQGADKSLAKEQASRFGKDDSNRAVALDEGVRGSVNSEGRLRLPPGSGVAAFAEAKNEAGKASESLSYGLESLLARLGYGAIDYQPEVWKGVTLDHPVYFENLYLGGNARLAYLDSLTKALASVPGEHAVHELAVLPVQGFDPPASGGVALHVDLDRVFVPHGEKERVFLQVGIKGGENLAWRRPPASLAFLPLVGPENAGLAQAVLEELHSGLDPQDKFAALDLARELRFIDASKPVAPLSSPGTRRRAVARTLRELREAFDAVEKGGALRNRRLVILADGRLTARVLAGVHALALEDVAVSVISLNPAEMRSHARAAMDGLGNLHVATDALGARRVARDELDSMARVVARALRLNIQPAPGARFIQVLGSRPLNVRETKRVKAREQAIDKNVERSTGIASDRGEDDPGLQTIIPYFLGGDEHVVLIEFEVEGPGPVAEVSMKLKDLVDMKNRTLRQSAALSRTPRGESQRQARVQSNVLGFAVARVLRQLEDDLDAGRPVSLDQLGQLNRELKVAAAVASERQSSLSADSEMLAHYLQLFEAGAPRDALSRSLEIARRARLGLSQEEGK